MPGHRQPGAVAAAAGGGRIAFLNDQAMYEQGRLLRNTERGKLAAEDANLSAGGVANAFSSAFGSPITEKTRRSSISC